MLDVARLLYGNLAAGEVLRHGRHTPSMPRQFLRFSQDKHSNTCEGDSGEFEFRWWAKRDSNLSDKHIVQHAREVKQDSGFSEACAAAPRRGIRL